MISNNKNKKDIDEADMLAEAIHANSSIPETEFRTALRKQFVAAIDAKPSRFNLFSLLTMPKLNKRIALAGGGLFAFTVTAVLAGTAIFLSTRPSLKPADKTAQEIFAAMANANNNRNSGSAVALNAAAPEASGTMDMKMIAPLENKAFQIFRTTTAAGPKAQECNAYTLNGLNSSSSESITYYNESEGNFSKYIVRGSDGQIYSYSLSDKTNSYEYNGGQFAVKTPAGRIYPMLLSRTAEESSPELVDPNTSTSSETGAGETLPAEEPITSPTEFKIEDFFGPDAKILGEEVIDGKTYYVATWKYDGYCGTGRENVKIATKTWVNKDTFSYDKEEIYLGEVNSGNLIVSNTNYNEKSTKEFSEVSNLFQFDLNVAIREVDPTINDQGKPAFVAAMKKMLSEQNLSFLVPNDTAYKFESYYSNKLELSDPNSYRLERGFYAPGSFGDKQFQEATTNYTQDNSKAPYLSASFSKNQNDKYSSFGFEVYAASIGDSEMKKLLNSDNSIPAEAIKFNFAGTQVDATLFDYSKAQRVEPAAPETKQEEGSGTSSTMPAECLDCVKINSYTILTKVGNHYYAIRVSGEFNKEQALGFAFKTLNSVSDQNTILEMMSKVEAPSDLIAL